MATSGNTSLFELISEEKRKKIERLLVKLTGPDEAAFDAALDCLLECEPVTLSAQNLLSVAAEHDSIPPASSSESAMFA